MTLFREGLAFRVLFNFVSFPLYSVAVTGLDGMTVISQHKTAGSLRRSRGALCESLYTLKSCCAVLVLTACVSLSAARAKPEEEVKAWTAAIQHGPGVAEGSWPR